MVVVWQTTTVVSQLALYKLQMPTNMRATDIQHMDNKWQFTGWRTIETQSV